MKTLEDLIAVLAHSLTIEQIDRNLIIEALKEGHELRLERDAAYEERNKLVRLLASIYPSGVATTHIPGWDDAWQNCVYVDLPTGQASWHYHDNERWLFRGLPPYTKSWDGHTTRQKYGRVVELSRRPSQMEFRDMSNKEREASVHVHYYDTVSAYYNVYLVNSVLGVRVAAGCRWFDFSQAYRHWERRRELTEIQDVRERAEWFLSNLRSMEAVACNLGWRS